MTPGSSVSAAAALRTRISGQLVQRRWSPVSDATDFTFDEREAGGQETIIDQWKRLVDVMTLELTYLYDEYARNAPANEPLLFEGPETLAPSSLDRLRSLTAVRFAAEAAFADADE